MSNSKFEQRSFREVLRKRELTIGSWLQLGSTDVAEIIANAGFEFLVVDMEHSATGINEAHQESKEPAWWLRALAIKS